MRKLRVGLLCTAYMFSGLNFTSVEARASSTQTRIAYLATQGKVQAAIDQYRIYCQQQQRPDYAVLQQLALCLLQQGACHEDAECRLLAIFGAGISAHERATYILADGMSSRNMEIALASMHLLAQSHNDYADALIHRAISSDNPLVRLEAIYALAKKKHPMAGGQAEALMAKLPKEVWFVFPEIYAAIGDTRSTRQLRRLMSDSHEDTRIAAVLATAETGRDDLLPQIRQIATHLDPKQQEASAYALGVLGDQDAVPRLARLVQSQDTHTRVAALLALYRLGRKECRKEVEQLGRQGHELAISALGEIEETEEVLAELTLAPHPHVRLNAILSLLRHRDPRCVEGLKEVLGCDAHNYIFIKVASHGKTLSAWKPSSTASLPKEQLVIASALSLRMREDALNLAIELPDETFLTLAEHVLRTEQNDLVPRTTMLLENMGSTESIELLKRYQQKIGAPLVRHYCNLSLYRLGVQGPYKEQLMQWIRRESHVNLIRFRTPVPLELRNRGEVYELTPEDTSLLLLNALEAVAQQQDEAGVELLLDVIRNGNPKSRYALAGLLLRATQ